ncbi:MAG: acyl carrier protein [Spirochaetales bacterium]|nr:acyl carrier protein [Spirochaetales bacterium]
MDNPSREKIESVVSRISRIPKSEFADDVLIREELGIDSLMAMEIVATLEREFSIEIDETEMFDIQTVGEFSQFVEARIRKSHG